MSDTTNTYSYYDNADRKADGTISATEGRAANFTNYAPGSLTITKTVQGNAGDKNKKFDFTVEFPDLADTVEFNYIGQGVPNGTIKSGGTISLAHDESITITGLPKDTKYKVTEADYKSDGYRTTFTNAENTINAGAESVAAFINSRNISSDPTGRLTVRKIVSGSDTDKETRFTFEITFDAGGWYSYSGSRSGMLSSGKEITLAHDEYIEIVGLPVGTTYKVTEKEANQDGYYTTSTGASGTIGRYGNTAEFTNSRGINPNTGDDDISGKALFALIGFVALLITFIGMDRVLAKRNKKRMQG